MKTKQKHTKLKKMIFACVRLLIQVFVMITALFGILWLLSWLESHAFWPTIIILGIVNVIVWKREFSTKVDEDWG